MHRVGWPDSASHVTWRSVAVALRPSLLAFLGIPCLLWAANRLSVAMGLFALELAGWTDLGHAVVSGVNVALLGTVLVVVLVAAYGLAGWAAAALIQGVLGLWAGSPSSRLGWAVELAALAAVWGAIFYALHIGVLAQAIPAVIESWLIWFGMPGLLYLWAAALHQGRVI